MHRLQLKSEENNQMSETSSTQTKRNRKRTILYGETNQVTFFNVKTEKLVGGNSIGNIFAFLVSGILGDYNCLFLNTGW